MLSLGGAAGSYGFTSDAQAQTFAQTMWDMFGRGTGTTYPRPFGSAVLDGIDLDIEGTQSIATPFWETTSVATSCSTCQCVVATDSRTPLSAFLFFSGGSTVGYAAFAKALRALAGPSFLISGAPQCPYPDALMGPSAGLPLGDAATAFSFVSVQFYNNWSLSNFFLLLCLCIVYGFPSPPG